MSGFRGVWKNDTWVRPFFARYGGVLALAVALGLLAFVFAGALMFTSGYMISLAATLPLTVLALHVPSLFVRIFGIGKPILQYLERLRSHDWVLRMTSALRRKLYDAFERATSGGGARIRVGEALGLLADDIEHVQNLYLRTVFPLVMAWLVYAVTIVAAGAFSVPVALALALLLGVAVFVLPAASVCVNGARTLRAQKLKSRLYDELTDNVLGVADWVFSGRGEDYLERYRDLAREARALDTAAQRFARVRDVLAQVMFGLVAVVLLVWAAGAFGGAGAAAEGAVGALAAFGSENAPAYAGNWIAAFVLCFFPLIEAFAPASDAAQGAVAHMRAIERLNKEFPAAASGTEGCARADAFAPASLDAPASTDAHDAFGSSDAPAPDAPASPNASDGANVDVELSRVAFRYPNAPANVIDDVTLRIPQGQKIAVLGRSGAGKSTLAALVRGEAAPQAGRVLVAGLDAHAQREQMPHIVGVIEQRPHLFNQTLRENLLVARGDATDAEMIEALEKVGLRGLYERLPHGLDTVVDEEARRFSGGERHRIALARVLLARVSVVILDEPFAGLDPATETALIRAMFDALEGCTVVMITHHLQSVDECDRVVFLDDGRIALDGSPDELAKTSDFYRRLLAFDCGLNFQK
ncbi:MAG: thiol reductant ABC exporter subunit CydC [Eggerthellaceae bacterium]|nr:thiol reductant ABC exporter subunit CydC [Eggerthellaceae bacterium]